MRLVVCLWALAAEGLTTSSVTTKETTELMKTQKMTAVVSSLGFAAVAADIFGGAGVMQELDDVARPSGARYDSVPGHVLSNVAPVLAVATGVAACNPEKDLNRRVAVAGSWVLLQPTVVGFKNYFHRQRPDQAHHRDWAFPSGHTANAAFLSSALALLLAKDDDAPVGHVVAATAIATTAVATGRILVDAHWLSDTIAGACIGIFFATLAAFLGNAFASSSDDPSSSSSV